MGADCEGEGLSLIHVPTIMKAVLNITRTFNIVVRLDFDFDSFYSGPSQRFYYLAQSSGRHESG